MLVDPGQALLLILALCGAAASSAETLARHQILGPDGKVLGFTSRDSVELADGTSKRRFHREVLLREQGIPARKILESTSIQRDAQNRVTKIERRYSVGRSESKITATIDGQVATIVRTARGDRRTQILQLPKDIVFDNGAAMLGRWDSSAALKLKFHTLDINAPALNLVQLSAVEEGNSRSRRTVSRKVSRVSSSKSEFFGVSHLSFDLDGDLVDFNQQSFGGLFKLLPTVTGKESLPLRAQSLLSQVLVKSPVRITSDARSGHIRFQLIAKGKDNFLLPQTGEQRVSESELGQTVDVCLGCGPGLPSDSIYLEASKTPTFWLQSDHPKLRKAVAAIGRMKVNDAKKMKKLAELASRRIHKLDFAGHVSALETLARRQGDCTESAVLLAAFGRAIGLSTKVASGVVYSRERYHGQSHVFMPHAWVLAYVDGQWRSFDAALAEFDSTHLAFTISDGDPGAIAAGHQLAGLVDFGSISEVRQRGGAQTKK